MIKIKSLTNEVAAKSGNGSVRTVLFESAVDIDGFSVGTAEVAGRTFNTGAMNSLDETIPEVGFYKYLDTFFSKGSDLSKDGLLRFETLKTTPWVSPKTGLTKESITVVVIKGENPETIAKNSLLDLGASVLRENAVTGESVPVMSSKEIASASKDKADRKAKAAERLLELQQGGTPAGKK